MASGLGAGFAQDAPAPRTPDGEDQESDKSGDKTQDKAKGAGSGKTRRPNEPEAAPKQRSDGPTTVCPKCHVLPGLPDTGLRCPKCAYDGVVTGDALVVIWALEAMARAEPTASVRAMKLRNPFRRLRDPRGGISAIAFAALANEVEAALLRTRSDDGRVDRRRLPELAALLPLRLSPTAADQRLLVSWRGRLARARLQMIARAQLLFAAEDPDQDELADYGDLNELIKAGLLPKALTTGVVDGWRYEVRPAEAAPTRAWLARARPAAANVDESDESRALVIDDREELLIGPSEAALDWKRGRPPESFTPDPGPPSPSREIPRGQPAAERKRKRLGAGLGDSAVKQPGRRSKSGEDQSKD